MSIEQLYSIIRLVLQSGTCQFANVISWIVGPYSYITAHFLTQPDHDLLFIYSDASASSKYVSHTHTFADDINNTKDEKQQLHCPYQVSKRHHVIQSPALNSLEAEGMHPDCSSSFLTSFWGYYQVLRINMPMPMEPNRCLQTAPES